MYRIKMPRTYLQNTRPKRKRTTKVFDDDDDDDDDFDTSSKGKGKKADNKKKNKKKKKSVTAADSDEDDFEAADPDAEYEVENVVDHRLYRNKLQYQIRWKGYKAADDTWENVETLSCPEIISRYQKKVFFNQSKQFNSLVVSR